MAEVNISDAAQSLYVDPTPAYQPALDFISQQRNLANERYAQNKADIANIFGQLTQVNAESQARVNKQFTESIANQQMATAQRVAEARMGAQQTQESALRAIDERGGGPMGNLAASPVAIEAERGIAKQNALQGIFQGQQGAIQQQTIQNLQAANLGYGQQQVQANQQLQRSLEDVLLGLSGQEAGIRGDLAGAKIAGQQTVRQANYQEILQKQAEEAAARRAAAAAANQPRQYSSGATGIFERIADMAGEDSAVAFSKSIADVLSGKTINLRKGRTAETGTPTSLSDALKQWIKRNPDMATYYQGYAQDVFSDIFSKTIMGTNGYGSQPSIINYYGNG